MKREIREATWDKPLREHTCFVCGKKYRDERETIQITVTTYGKYRGVHNCCSVSCARGALRWIDGTFRYAQQHGIDDMAATAYAKHLADTDPAAGNKLDNILTKAAIIEAIVGTLVIVGLVVAKLLI